MTYTGRVKNGVVVLDNGADLAEGTPVRIVPEPVQTAADERGQTLYDLLESVIGKAEDLPADLAEQHDHYLHGRPKK